MLDGPPPQSTHGQEREGRERARRGATKETEWPAPSRAASPEIGTVGHLGRAPPRSPATVDQRSSRSANSVAATVSSPLSDHAGEQPAPQRRRRGVPRRRRSRCGRDAPWPRPACPGRPPGRWAAPGRTSPAVLGEAAGQPDVDRTPEVSGGEVLGSRVSMSGDALAPGGEDVVEGSGVLGSLSSRVAWPRGSCWRRTRSRAAGGLALRDHLTNVLRHRGQRVVRAPLLADRGGRLRRQVLAARRAGAVGRVHPGRVGQGRGVARATSGRAGGPSSSACRRPRRAGRVGRRRR